MVYASFLLFKSLERQASNFPDDTGAKFSKTFLLPHHFKFSLCQQKYILNPKKISKGARTKLDNFWTQSW